MGRSTLFEVTAVFVFKRDDWNMTGKVFNVLFLCIGNSARSIMAEALVNRYGSGRFKAFSAGIEPSGEVHQFTIAMLKTKGLPTESLRSKHWREFATPEAPRMDFVISVCELPPPEVWLDWPGNPVRAHWRIADPVRAEETIAESRRGFERALRELENRVRLFLLLRHEEASQSPGLAQSYGPPPV